MIHTHVAHTLVLFGCLSIAACGKTPEPEPEVEPRLMSVKVVTEEVVLSPQGTADILFEVNEPNAVFNYNATSSACQVTLRLSGSTQEPSSYHISTVAPTEVAGQYKATLTDLGKQRIYREKVVVGLITSESAGSRSLVYSNAFSVVSMRSQEGLVSWSLTRALNPSLEKDIVASFTQKQAEGGAGTGGNASGKAGTGGDAAGQAEGDGWEFVSRTPNYVKSRAFVASFTCGSPLKVDGKVQESGVTVQDFSKPVVYQVAYSDGTSDWYTVSLSNFTGLPVVIVTTQDGVPITSKEDWVESTFSIDGMGLFEDFAEAPAEVRGRGNTTWEWPKKPYAIKLGSKASVLGMPKHKRWVLLANFMDRTMLRNRMAFKAAQATSLAWTPRSQIVELILNGKHLGNYLLTEQIKEDKNRVNISDEGFLLELDFHWDNPIQWISPWGKAGYADIKGGIPFAVKFPEDDEITSAQVEAIQTHIEKVASTLYGPDFLDPDHGYRQYIDLLSFVDYWLVFELCINHELGNPGSVYMYKDKDTKLFAGPTWDFDWGSFSYDCSPQAKGKLFLTQAIWYQQLTKDPDFMVLAKERWQAVKGAWMQLPAFLDQEAAYAAASAQVNFAMWNPADDKSMNNGHIINGDENMTYDAAVTRMRKILVERLETLDALLSQ